VRRSVAERRRRTELPIPPQSRKTPGRQSKRARNPFTAGRRPVLGREPANIEPRRIDCVGSELCRWREVWRTGGTGAARKLISRSGCFRLCRPCRTLARSRKVGAGRKRNCPFLCAMTAVRESGHRVYLG